MRWTNVILSLTLAPAGVFGAEAMVDSNKLETMAANAKSTGQHAAVAKLYRLQAESFESKAKQHETEARELEARPGNAMDHKWPAMSSKKRDAEKARQLAVQARRAAQESFQLADRHLRLTIESEFAQKTQNVD